MSPDCITEKVSSKKAIFCIRLSIVEQLYVVRVNGDSVQQIQPESMNLKPTGVAFPGFVSRTNARQETALK